MAIDTLIKSYGMRLKELLNNGPSGLEPLREDLQQQLQSVLRDVLRQADWVSREEFEVQQAVLLKTRHKIEALTQQVESLEKQLAEAP